MDADADEEPSDGDFDDAGTPPAPLPIRASVLLIYFVFLIRSVWAVSFLGLREWDWE